MLAHAGLLAIFDLVRDAGALVALGAHDLHLGSVHGSLTLHDAAEIVEAKAEEAKEEPKEEKKAPAKKSAPKKAAKKAPAKKKAE